MEETDILKAKKMLDAKMEAYKAEEAEALEEFEELVVEVLEMAKRIHGRVWDGLPPGNPSRASEVVEIAHLITAIRNSPE